MALANFPINPVNGTLYTINGVVFKYVVTDGVGEFIAQGLA